MSTNSGLGKKGVPAADDSYNSDVSDVVGNKDDTLMGDSISSIVKNISGGKHVTKTQTFAGGGGSSDNIFQITDSVVIVAIFGEVTTVLNANVGNVKLELDDGGGQSDLTTATDLSSAPVGSLIMKNNTAGNAITYLTSANRALNETLPTSFILVQKNGANTYIKSNYAGVATDGVIQWHVIWKPLSATGNVVAA